MHHFRNLIANFATYAPDGVGGYGPSMTDEEIAGLEAKKGPSHIANAASFPRGARLEPETSAADSIAWKVINQTNPFHDSSYWEECRALYSGGRKLLRNKTLMERVFPSHNAEDPQIYAERCKRAHYFPYPGAIIDSITSGLGADPIAVLPADPDDKAAKLPEWWKEFFEDVTRDGTDRLSLQHFVVNMIREAMITSGLSWALVDMPKAPEGSNPQSKLDQEKAGLLDPYVVPLAAENVIDWHEKEGELDWIIIRDTELRRESIFSARDTVTHTFTMWTRDEWLRYQISHPIGKPPKKDEPVQRVGNGRHAFGQVPVLRLKLPEGLCAMDKLESMAREHLNKRNALSWAEYKSLFALLYEFLAPEESAGTRPTSEAQANPDRAIDGIRGQGYANERGHEDRAEFIGPPTAPFSEARESCDQIKREMYRVMHSMADSAEMSSSAARRSGESKAQDGKSKDILLKALGEKGREVAKSLMDLLQIVKGDEDHRIGGGDSFDNVDLMSKVMEAVELLNGVPMKSPTFLRVYLERLYSLVLKDGLTDKEKEQIRRELAEMITMEDLMMAASMPPGPLPPGGDDEDEDEDEDEEDEKKPSNSIPLKPKIDYKG